MLKMTFLTTAAVAMLGAGALALDAKPAEAGVSVQLVHGKKHGHRGKWRRHGPRAKRFHGPRFGYYWPRPRCFTRYRTRRVSFWSPRKHRWVTRAVTRPIRICR